MATVQNPGGIPRWVMTIDLLPKKTEGGQLILDGRVKCPRWRLRLWLAWRLLTAPMRRETVDD